VSLKPIGLHFGDDVIRQPLSSYALRG